MYKHAKYLAFSSPKLYIPTVVTSSLLFNGYGLVSSASLSNQYIHIENPQDSSYCQRSLEKQSIEDISPSELLLKSSYEITEDETSNYLPLK